MLNEKQYTYKELIEAYIAAKRQDVPDAFKTSYTARLTTLQDLFGIHFTPDDVRVPPPPEIATVSILWLFDLTVESYLVIRTPWDGFIEGGLGVSELARHYGQDVFALSAQYRAAHLTLLDTFFTLLYGEVDQVFTSADLRRSGFDDRDEPSMSTYWEDL